MKNFIVKTALFTFLMVIVSCSNTRIKSDLSGAEYSRNQLISSTIYTSISTKNFPVDLKGSKIYYDIKSSFEGPILAGLIGFAEKNNINLLKNQQKADYELMIFDFNVGANEYLESFWWHILYFGYSSFEFNMKSSVKLGYKLTNLKTKEVDSGIIKSDNSIRTIQLV